MTVGDTFDITIQIADVVDLWQWVVGLSWNRDVLAMQGSPVEGPFLKAGGTTLFLSAPANNTGGFLPEVSSTLLSATSVSGSRVLATVTFQIVGYGSSTIDFVDARLRDKSTGHVDIPFTSTGSTFNLPSPSPTPSPSIPGNVVEKAQGEAFTVEIEFENTGGISGEWSVNIAFEGDHWFQTGNAQNLQLDPGEAKSLEWTGTVPADAPINTAARLVVYYADSFKALDWWIVVVPREELTITSSTLK